MHIESVKVRVLPGGRDGRGKVDRKNCGIALNRAPKTLADWQTRGIGPRGYSIGGRVFYDWSEVEIFQAGASIERAA